MLKNVSIKKLFVFQVVGLVVLTIITACVFYYMNNKISVADEKQAEDVKLHSILHLRYIDHLYWLSALKDHIYESKNFDKTIDPTKCEFGKWYYSYKPTDPEEKKIYDAIELPHRRFHESAKDILNTNDISKKKEIFLTVTEPLIKEIREHLTNYQAYLDKKIEKGYEIMDKTTRIAEIFVLSLLGFLCVSNIGMFFVMKKKLFQPINECEGTLDLVSKGDLTANINFSSRDEIGSIAEKLKEMTENLKDMIKQIAGNAQQVSSASEELSSTALQLRKNAEGQSQQIEQVAAAMAKMSQTIMDVAKNASDTAEISKEATNIAKKGKEAVEKTVHSIQKIADTVKSAANTIDELGKNSNEIGNIIRVIDDIADQTNLLALNAAIEAARAGEQGRGFAVVADEVRKLAERTGKATKEIALMIKKIQEDTSRSVESMNIGVAEVESGVNIASEATSALDMIVESSSRSLDMVQRIAAATEEQSAASEQVSQNIESIVGTTKMTLEAIEQIAQASSELARLASELQRRVDMFKYN